jgi:hypothetical protein
MKEKEFWRSLVEYETMLVDSCRCSGPIKFMTRFHHVSAFFPNIFIKLSFCKALLMLHKAPMQIMMTGPCSGRDDDQREYQVDVNSPLQLSVPLGTQTQSRCRPCWCGLHMSTNPHSIGHTLPTMSI